MFIFNLFMPFLIIIIFPFIIFSLSANVTLPRQNNPATYQAGQTICFLGNRITQSGLLCKICNNRTLPLQWWVKTGFILMSPAICSWFINLSKPATMITSKAKPMITCGSSHWQKTPDRIYKELPARLNWSVSR